VGMGQALSQTSPEIAEIYRQANDMVGYDLAKTCFEGPEETLNRTDISQPAIFVTSVACLRALRLGLVEPSLANVEPDVCAGLSLGEYTALHAAGAMSFEEGLKLVQLRGRSMQDAAQQSRGGMVSILGLEEEAVNRLCEKACQDAAGQAPDAFLAAVNFNCPGQIVISGTRNACEKAAQLAEGFGAMKAIPLKVAGAFHTRLMDPAAEKLGEALRGCRFSQPKCLVVSNVNGRYYGGAGEIVEKLLTQLVKPVRWQQSMEWMLDEGVERFVEIGPGRVLAGLGKKILRDRKSKAVLMNIGG